MTDSLQRGERDQDLALYDFAAVSTSVEKLEKLMGGRAQIIEALLNAPPSPETQTLIGAIADPANDRVSLARLCAMNRLPIGALTEVYKKGRLALAHVEATNKIADALPSTVEDVMTRSAPHEVTCQNCEGVGTVVSKTTPDAAPTVCPGCRGKGTQYVLPDLERQKMALELGGLGPKRMPATVVTVDNRKVNLRDSSQANLEKMLYAADAVLRRGASVTVEAEAVSSSEDSSPSDAPVIAPPDSLP